MIALEFEYLAKCSGTGLDQLKKDTKLPVRQVYP